MDRVYIDTVRLLLEVAPAVFTQPDFAMKGGTAINLFVDDMPRLSVDIDVVYTDYKRPREAALQAISSGLQNIASLLSGRGLDAEIISMTTGEDIRMFVKRRPILVKIEVNHVFRGTVLPIGVRHLGAEASRVFATDISLPVLAAAELYGSKLVAALDRQHPRDFFDVRSMYQGGGLTPEIIDCFVCYLAGHNRPVHEVLFSRDQDMGPAFQNEFAGMTREPVELEELVQVRRRLRRDLPSALTSSHRNFLMGLVAAQPDWGLMSCPHLKDLPAIRWKLQNLERLKKSKPRKFAEQTDELRHRMDA